jgi:hypothetical protein
MVSLVRLTVPTQVLLAKLEGDKLTPADRLLQIKFKHPIDTEAVRNNLFYHLKYNDVSLDVLKFKSIKVKI